MGRAKRHFQTILRTHPADWSAAQLSQLTAAELEYLCRLMAIPHSNTKAARVKRLLDAADLRTIPAPYTHPEQMTPIFTRRALAALARRAGLWNGATKWGLANALLGWRDQCRAESQQFHAEMRAAVAERRASQPRQESFFSARKDNLS